MNGVVSSTPVTVGRAKVLAWLAFFPVPVMGGLGMWLAYHLWGGAPIAASWGSALEGLGVVLFMLGAAAGVMKCSIWQTATGALGGIGLGLLGGWPMVGMGLIGVALVWVGLMQTYMAWEKLDPRVDGCETQDERARRNPRCVTCHVSKACPLQPGGIADRYQKVTVMRDVASS